MNDAFCGDASRSIARAFFALTAHPKPITERCHSLRPDAGTVSAFCDSGFAVTIPFLTGVVRRQMEGK
jgi:hypothetical protein